MNSFDSANIVAGFRSRMESPQNYESTPTELVERLISTGVPRLCVWGAYNQASTFDANAQTEGVETL